MTQLMKAARFWDRIAPRYSASPIKDVESYEHKLQKTAEHLTPDSELLEFGCGTGGTALHHARHVHQVTAVDISEKMIGIARQQARKEAITNVRFLHGDLFSLERSATFDMVLGLSVMHLIEDRRPVFERVRQLLRPGGLFVTNTVCIGESAPLLKYVAPLGGAVGVIPPLSVFCQDAWIDEVKSAGFELEYQFSPKGRQDVCFLIARA